MTAISTVYDHVVTRIQTLLGATYLKLPNPMNLKKNPEPLLANGWGLTLAQGGSNTERYAGASRSFDVNLEAIITKKIQGNATDQACRNTAIKALLEAADLILADIQENNLNLVDVNADASIFFGGLNGVEDVLDSETFYALRVNLRLEFSLG